jgi:hypothetical protein
LRVRHPLNPPGSGPFQAIHRILPVPALEADEFGLAVYLFDGNVTATSRTCLELHHLFAPFRPPEVVFAKPDYSTDPLALG